MKLYVPKKYNVEVYTVKLEDEKQLVQSWWAILTKCVTFRICQWKYDINEWNSLITTFDVIIMYVDFCTPKNIDLF